MNNDKKICVELFVCSLIDDWKWQSIIISILKLNQKSIQEEKIIRKTLEKVEET